MIKVTARDTNFSEIPTGEIDTPLAQFVAKWNLRADNGVYVAEWGNGEGADTFDILVIPTTTAEYKREIERAIENGYAETRIGYHAEYRMWEEYWQRGCYAQIGRPYGGTRRIYARSWFELYLIVMDME